MKQFRLFIFLFIAILCKANAAGFVLVANKDVNMEKISQDNFRNIFLGNKTHWENDKKVRVCQLTQEHPATKAMIESGLKMNVEEFNFIWRNRLFSGRAVPPRKFDEESKLIAYISENPGAIGFVSGKDMPKDKNIQLLEIQE